jgi:hypothetical protein
MDRNTQYEAMLADEGYRPKIDEDGDISFKVEGEKFVLYSSPDDESYLRIVTVFTLDDDTDPERALALTSTMNYRMKAVKFSLGPGLKTAAFSIEAFYGEPEHFRPFLGRALNMLKSGSSQFFAQLRSSDDLDEED